MAILTGPEIIRLIGSTRASKRWAADHGVPEVLFVPRLDIEPFDPARAGPNSYDVTLADKLLVYNLVNSSAYLLYGSGAALEYRNELDVRRETPTTELTIPPDGMVLLPGILYLGSTVERTACHGLIPWLDGRSSVGRLGIQIHATAGRGDDGWEGTWTLEITVTHPVRVYPGMRIGQLTFFTTRGERAPYAGRYQHQAGPTASRMHQPDALKE